MTKGEEQTIRNILARLEHPRLGSGGAFEPLTSEQRLYVRTWITAPLELLLPEKRDVRLAEQLSRK